MSLNIFCHSLLDCRFSVEKFAISLIGIPLYVIFCFSLVASYVYFLLVLLILSWCTSLWIYPLWNSPGFLDLGGYFLFHVKEVFNNNLKYFLLPFLFLFFWDLYNLSTFNIVPEVSKIVLNSFHSLFFTLLLGSYFYHSTFQLTYLFCLSYSAINRAFLISLNVFFITVYSLFLLDLC